MGNKFAVYCINFVALTFNLALILTSFLIPLYGLKLGMSAGYIGFLLSVPGLSQLAFRLIGGAISDSLGEKSVLFLTFGSALLAGLFFSYLSVPVSLIAGQVFMGIARAFYWIGSQSYVSRIPGIRKDKALGNLSSFVFIGRIIGMGAGGLSIHFMGYESSFQLITWIAAAGITSILLLPKLPQKSENKDFYQSLKSIPTVMKHKPIQLSLLLSFTGGIMVSLSDSFFPIWLKTLGFDEGIVSFVMILRLIGIVITGAAFGYTLARLGHRRMFMMSGLVTGIVLLFIPFFLSLVPIGMIVFYIGLTSGYVVVHYQVIAAEHSKEENRGLTFSVVGYTWAMAYMVGPVSFGFLIDQIGIQWSFFLLGVILIIFSLFTGKIHDYYLPQTALDKKSVTLL